MDNKLDIFALIKSIVKHRKFIVNFVIFVSIVAVIFSLVFPKHWQSTAEIAVSSNSAAFPGVLKSLISSYSPGLENLAGNDEADLQGEILNSRDFSEKAVRKFNLTQYFRFTKRDWDKDSLAVMDESIKKLNKKVLSNSVNEVTGTIRISAITKNKVLSRDLVSFYVDELDRYNKEERISKGRDKREFLEKRITQVEDELNQSANDLSKFQQGNNIISLDEQVTAAIDTYSSVLKQKIETSTELEFMLSYLPKDNPKINEVKKKLASINKQIDKMQNDNFSKYLPNFDDVNGLSLQYMKKKMNLEILGEIYKSLIPQFEIAKLEEINDLTSIQYIQRPTLDGVREKPKRAMICIVAFFSALFLSCFAGFIYDLLETQKDRFKESLRIH